VKLLVQVITGGRPLLESRPTRKILAQLTLGGFTDIEWVLRADHVEQYERDDYPLNSYPVSWANEYAKKHWRHPTAVFEPGGFHGAFTGREWAMRSGEERGFDAVLQLDDNITLMGLMNCTRPTYREAMDPATMVRLLAELTDCTTAAMCGMQLNSVPPVKVQTIRPGYPYSCFIEKTGPGRMPYFGPYEDDIMHALDYGLNGGPLRTAAVVEGLVYLKESKSGTGMRKHYDASRGLEIARRYPNNVSLKVSRRTSGPVDKSLGVRHFLRTRGFTPVRVTDRDRFLAAEKQLHDGITQAIQLQRASARAKTAKRAGRT
jgi:hypothetical protein